ncbi:hypothetical protein DAPPUDRAFT_102703 [Daphnia pulex]|uniref:MYND-type domain-containing protein n=1 Tax=Daphnia pulex TaxID=6669 RepID=E9GH83_DAPPU|nr:hypothetical protein DAPPUDRAFT_102703 [Daphnia pulex]|eukprot:EFX81229.1 hypothetical protein DAPPUDRAFT_102703 [Daphnia pulex]
MSEIRSKIWCSNCGLLEGLYHCCLGVFYCDVKCEDEHWNTGHAKLCKIKRIGMNVSLEAIKFAVFGKVMDVEENLNAGLSRSVFITYFTRDAVRSALNVSFFGMSVHLEAIKEKWRINAWMSKTW